MKGLTLLGVLLLAGCSQGAFAEDKQDNFGIQPHIQDMEQSCNKAKGAYQIQQFTIPDGSTLFQFVCTNVKQQPKPQPPVDGSKVQAP